MGVCVSDRCTCYTSQASPAAATGDRADAARALDAEMEAERRMAAMVCSIKNKDDCVMCGS